MAEVKKGVTTDDSALPRQSAITFIGDVKAEFQKITWTSSEELKLYTKIVVAATVAFGMAIYGVDLLIQGTLSGFAATMRFIIG